MDSDITKYKKFCRRNFLRAVIYGGIGLTAADAFFIEPYGLDVTRMDIPIYCLPDAFNGFRIVQLTDLHHSKVVGIDYIRKVIDALNFENPDLVVLTGDYVTGNADYIKPVINLFTGIKSKYGLFAVLGNHDHWVDANLTIKHLTDVGAVDLTNKHVIVSIGNDSICIAGVGDYWEGTQDLNSAFQYVSGDMPRILLSHNPDYAEVMPTGYRVDLMLCGHTHGGQVVVPFVGAPMVPSDYGNKYRAGLVQGPHCPVYISRGIGMIRPPVRFNCQPELPVFTLKIKN
ncbi:MAG: metallophosphoesterase [bacterium]